LNGVTQHADGVGEESANQGVANNFHSS